MRYCAGIMLAFLGMCRSSAPRVQPALHTSFWELEGPGAGVNLALMGTSCSRSASRGQAQKAAALRGCSLHCTPVLVAVRYEVFSSLGLS